MGLLIMVQLLLYAMAVHGQDLTVTIGPDLVTGVEEIVSGSVIQLFCTAVSTTGVAPAVAWARNGATLDNNPPSVYFRTSSDGTSSTSSVLTIGDFQSADDGTYTCVGSIPGSGTTVSSGGAALTAISFVNNDANAISLFRDPVDNEVTYDAFDDDRVSVALGTLFDPATTAGGDRVMVAAADLGSFRNLEIRSIVWVRDGVVVAENEVTIPPENVRDPITIDPRYSIVTNAIDNTPVDAAPGMTSGRWQTILTISGFQASDAGVYQVIYTDNVVGGEEVLTTTPIRLDTDETAALTRVSAAIIDLDVGSELLLIEVSASGSYQEITWQRNGMALTSPFVSHDEVYYQTTTDTNDLGEYTITAATGGVGPSVTVAVLPYTIPSTTIMGSAPITVVEGGSVNITCTSTGIFTPTIEWELVDTDPLPFMPVDGTPVDPVITEVSPFTFSVGSLTSTLPITNAVFPTHEGMYRCTGTNTHNGVSATDVATDVATVQVIVQVAPVVQVTADRSRIQIGGMITLTCTVTRSNPSDSYMYTWTLLPSTVIAGPISSTESTNTLQVTPDAMDDYGTYQCSVDNGALTGTADTTIEQGFPPVVSISGAPTEPTTDTSVDLTCMTGNGDLPINLEWVSIADTGTILSMDAMYTVNVSGEVTYRCTAMNEFGTVSDEVTVAEALPPVITPAGPTPVSVLVGEALNLAVNITGFNLPLTAITWSFGGITLMDGMDRISITTPADLTTPPVIFALVRMPIVSLEDAGCYEVTASNLVGNVQSTFNITVNAPPNITFPTEPTEATVDRGDSVTLTCSAFGAPAPEFEWFMASSMIALVDSDLSGRVTISSMEMRSDFFYVNSTLTISSTEASDAATYTCRATNSVNTVGVEETYTLVVNFQAMITDGPADTEAEYLSNVYLNCTARGVPMPDFTWTVDSGSGAMDVVESGQISITTMPTGNPNEQMSTLALISVEPSLANYTCNVNNSLGSDSSVAILEVQAEPEILSTVPTDPTTANVNIGLDIVLMCTARGAPEPTFAWFRGVTELTASDPRVTITPGPTSGAAPDFVTVESTISITESLETDVGTYSCVASNMVFSEPRSDTVDFTVMINFAPTIVDAPENLTAFQPDNAIFSCQATGGPRPSITWQRLTSSDSGFVQILMTDPDYSIDEMEIGEHDLWSNLTILGTMPRDTGEYLCQVENMISSAEESAFLTVQVIPVIGFPEDSFSYTVNESQPIEFSCQAIGIPAPTISWYRNDVLFDENFNDRISIDPPAITPPEGPNDVFSVLRTLTLNSTMDNDSDTYTCVADNGNSRMPCDPDMQDFELVVNVAPMVLIPPEDLTVVSPNNATFFCQATARPRPAMTWWRREDGGINQIMATMGEYIITNVEIGERVRNSTLVIVGSEPFDTGEYLCQAENEVSTDSTTANLTVYVTPNIVFPESDSFTYTVNVTDAVTFVCRARGIPVPVITWNRNGLPLNETDIGPGDAADLNSQIIVEPPSQSLILTSIGNVYEAERNLTIYNTMGGETGTYTCEADNGVNPNDTQEFELFVQVPPVVVVLADGQEVIGNETDSVTLEFRINNAAPLVALADLTWYYSSSLETMPQGEDITGLMNRTSQSMLTFSEFTGNTMISLTVSNLVRDVAGQGETDEGRYFLVARNPAGINFDYIDVVIFGAPTILGPPQDQFEINNGSNATFRCEAFAFPSHEIDWTFTNVSGVTTSIISTSDVQDSMKYSVNRMRTISTFGILTVQDVQYEDRGRYNCTARNFLGSDTAFATLTVHVTPVIEDISNTTEVNVTNPATLACLTTAFPLVSSITWQKNGEALLLGLDGRISTFEFEINDTYMSSGFLGNGSIESVVSMAGFTEAQVDGLGDLGVVGVLTFESLVRDDTASYTCTATNSLPQTAVLSTVSDPISLVVLERPDPPVNVEAFSNGARSVAIRWQPEFDGNRPIQQFVLHQQILDGEFVMVETLNIDVLMFVDGFYRYNISTDILPFTSYSFAVQSCNELGCSEFSDASEEIQTDEDSATAPQNLRVATDPDSVGQRYVVLLWDLPIMPNGIIARYRIYYIGTKEVNLDFSDVDDAFTLGAGRMMNLTGLTPDTMYTITVAAINGAGEGDRSTAITQRTDMAPPDAVVTPSIPEEQTAGDRTATIVITRPDDTNGPLSHYQVVAVLLPTGTTPQNNGLSNPDADYPSLATLQANTYEDLSDCLEPTVAQAYIAAEFSDADFPTNNQYIVGLETQPNDQQNLYRNGPLCYARTYTFFLRAYPLGAAGTQKRQIDNRQYDLFSSSSYTVPYLTPAEPASIVGIAVGVVVGVIVGVAIIIIIVVIVCYTYRKRRMYVHKSTAPEVDQDATFIAASDNLKLTEYNTPVDGTLVRQPIPVGALASHIERMRANENCGFGEEYKMIQENSPKHSVEACIAPDNKPRNRYANIQCFDHSRVHLTRIEGFEHDYINGNFIDGYNHRNEYVATQGPLPDTVGDFWRLVWDHDCTTIVMLTNLVEKMKMKCTQYWPDSGTQQYSNISVTLNDSIIHADFIIRNYQIKNVYSDEVKRVSQFHFVSWPDFGVPRHATPLLYFLWSIRTAHPYSNQHPILIHCSAGVGRTGSLITIDVELQRARQEGVVDPFSSVLKMRQQRNHMVQTEVQYVFIHDTVLEGITSGNTEITVDRLSQRMSELEGVGSDGETGYQKEFNRLRQFKVDVREFTDANDNANKFKNRIANALPYNYNRVHLQMSPGVGGSDYINASYVDDYTQKGAYIATQGPLVNTIEDFWRMVWEKEAYVIVMLTQLEEKGKEQCAAYWPETTNSPEKHGSLTVELLSETTYEDYVVREFKVTGITAITSSSCTVRQFHFQAWPENGAPTCGAGMIDLVDQVTQTQQQTGNKAIVIHCSAGIGRTGAFCALSLAIERVKAEGMVDIFHTIKHLRTQRPHMVQTVEQYIFCYHAIKEYVDSLNQYSNFQ